MARQEELNGEACIYWEEQLTQSLKGKNYKKALDIECGPGFFFVLPAQMGYEVAGVWGMAPGAERRRESYEL